MGKRLANVPVVVTVAVAVGLAGCGGSEDEAGPASAAPSARAPSAQPAQPRPGPALPAADAAIPADPARAANALRQTSTALGRAVDEWRGGAAAADVAQGEPPRPVVLLALHQQRIYRVLARRPELARRTIARLPGPLAAQARDNVAAGRALFSLTRPVQRANIFRTQEPLTAATLLGYMRRAERRFGVDWQVLAAVMHVETKFGRIKSASSAGAQGPMQFIPATWRAYGLGGDVHDPRDAVLGAANYLRASGAPGDYDRALFAYNHDRRYVAAVQRYARQMRRDPRAYYTYYNWQVFVLTTRGDVRVTGPSPLPRF
jgi:membrane-bound lytic murein transglycosylase B